jgi:hypothetical protein
MMGDDTEGAPITLAHFDETRTCPCCGGTLRPYEFPGLADPDEHRTVHVLACMSCPWGIADGAAPWALYMNNQIARDRHEHAELERRFQEGGA